MDNPLVQVDPGLAIWTILTFTVLAWLLKKYTWGPLLEFLDAREARIKKSVDDAKKATAELQRVQEDSARLMAEARAEAAQVLARSRADADRFREEMRKKAQDDAAAIVANAEKNIQLETARAVSQLRAEAVDLSVAIASKLLRKNISAADNDAIIQDALGQFRKN